MFVCIDTCSHTEQYTCVGGGTICRSCFSPSTGSNQGSKSGSQVSVIVVCSHKDTVIGSFPYKICFRC